MWPVHIMQRPKSMTQTHRLTTSSIIIDIKQENGFHVFNVTMTYHHYHYLEQSAQKWCFITISITMCHLISFINFEKNLHNELISQDSWDQHKCDNVHNLYRKHKNVYIHINFSSSQRAHEVFKVSKSL